MSLFIIVLVLIGGFIIYKNKDYLKCLLKEHFCGCYDKSDPPFCFDCNFSDCDTCKALKAYKKGNKSEAWAEFHNRKWN